MKNYLIASVVVLTGIFASAAGMNESFSGNYQSINNCDVHIEIAGKDLIVSFVRLPRTGVLDNYNMPDCSHPSNYYCTGETQRYRCQGRICSNGSATMTLLGDGNIFFEWSGRTLKSIKSTWLNIYWCPSRN